MVHKCKMIISPGFFFFFKILIFQVVRRVKDQKMAQNDKKLCLFCLLSQGPYIVWSSFMVHICERISPVLVFFFLQILIFGVNIWATGEKMAQNDNKLYLSHSISQEAYIMWPWFLVCRCKIMTSPLSFFLNFDFLGCYGAKWQKTTQNGQKICLSHSISQEPYLIWSWFLVHLRKMMISPASFFIFSKFQIFWFLGGVGKKVKKWPIITNFSLSNSISQEL